MRMNSTHFMDEVFLKELLRSLFALQGSSQHTDVILRSSGISVPCHKVVLCAASPYFQSMFDSDANQGCSSEIEFTDVDVSALVRYIYTGEIDINISNAHDLILSSHQFDFNNLEKKCVEFLLHQLEPSNCLSLCRFAENHGFGELANGSKCFTFSHFEDVITTKEFINLSEEELVKYISDESFALPNRNVVFEAVLLWTKGNLNVRRESFPSIIEHVQLASCSADYLRDVVRKEPLMENLKCQRVLIEALCEQQALMQGTSCAGDVPQQVSLVILGGIQTTHDSSKSCWVMNESHPSSWEILTEMPHDWRWFSACDTPQGIMLSGGCDKQLKNETRECWMLETETSKWKPVPPMAQARCKHGSVFHQGSVYVFGGHRGRGNADVERYDLQSKKWITISQMQQPRQAALVVSCAGSIFVLSGHDGKWLCMNQMLNTDSGKWSSRAELPEPCPGGSAVSMSNKIYVVGGENLSSLLYDPSSDTWTCLCRPSLIHKRAPAVEWKGRIVVAGGLGSTAIEEYDPETNQWSVWKSTMKEQVHYHGMVSIHY